MQITSLEQAEEIVSKYPWLSWEGWDIIHKSQDDYAEYLPNGTFSDGKWYKTERYQPQFLGWSIPDRIIPRWAG